MVMEISYQELFKDMEDEAYQVDTAAVGVIDCYFEELDDLGDSITDLICATKTAKALENCRFAKNYIFFIDN